MITANVQYQGQLRTQAIHLKSNNQIITDAPTDNHGKGEAFSPTDLLATSLASCILTVLGIRAEGMNIDLSNTLAEVTKVMSTAPRRVSEVKVIITFQQSYDDKTTKIFEAAALACPVAQSLHPDLKQDIQFVYADT